MYKSVVHVQSCCFAIKTYCVSDLLVTVRVASSTLFNEGNTK